MNKHMHEKTDPPIKPLWKTVVLWQSIFSVFCGLFFSGVLNSLGFFTIIMVYPFISIVWSFKFFFNNINKKRYFRGLLPLFFSLLSLYPTLIALLLIYIYSNSFVP